MCAAEPSAAPERPLVWPGRPSRLGVHWDGAGVNVAVAAPSAEAVELCLLGPGSETRVRLPEEVGGVWFGYLPGIGPGQRYGLRVHGPYDPSRGLRHNAAKLLVDPYTRQLSGDLVLHPAIFGYAGSDPHGPMSDERDSAPYVPHGVVVDGGYDWGVDRPPRTPWPDTIVYELHVRGFTRLHPGLPPGLRGTYAGLAHPSVVEYLVGLGVTTIELMPVHAFASEPHLLRKGLSNYWGYNTLGFFAPHAGYAAGDDPLREFRDMVRALHTAGLEVILDVVYNHTAEGDEYGPTLAFRGLDNATYYRLQPLDPSRYRDYTGCGSTLDLRSPHTLRLVLDSLRYWLTEMHVDGFRFDLAPALARSPEAFDATSAFLAAIHADPLLSEVKLVAEPWDVGPGGYQPGAFPARWSEWNGRYRDTVRYVWRGSATSVADLGYRLSGSSDLYEHDGRRPYASVNFITAHDGFPLADLVSYQQKHNEANGEGNRDGDDHSHSTNCGVEGPTHDPAVLLARRRLRRALLSTLMLSIGVPMLLAGDELGHSQGGNNNAYCQDNEIAWLDWAGGTGARDPAGPDPQLLPLVRALLALRRRSPALRRSAFFRGGPSTEERLADLTWFTVAGVQMGDGDWHSSGVPTLALHLSGAGLPQRGPRGEPVVDASYLLVLHAGAEDRAIRLPGRPWASSYVQLLDTAADDLGGFPDGAGRQWQAGRLLPLRGRSVVLLRTER